MKFLTHLFGLLSIAPAVFAHCKWPALIINDQVTGDWQHVRENINNINTFMDLYSTDLRCNECGLASGPHTDTAIVAAGSKVMQEVLARGT
jgi:hypothetical protein